MGEQRRGLVYGFAAYGVWGLFPLYWPLLKPAGAMEILAHRMVWSLVVVALILLALRRWAWIAELARQPQRLGLVAVAATMVSVNWGMYIWGVNSGHVVETSLGYFINPLVTIALGVLVLHERLRPVQWTAVGIGCLAVVVLAVGYGRLPWIALTLAFSFGTYGLVKKKIAMGGLESLAAETSVQFLPALGFLLVLGARGQSTFTSHGPGHAALLAMCGLVTAVPLIFFGDVRDPAAAVHDRPDPVPGAGVPVPDRGAALPREHAGRALGRLPAGVGRAAAAHLGRAALGPQVPGGPGPGPAGRRAGRPPGPRAPAGAGP